MKKIGLMGCGAVADYGHIPALLEVKELELYALYDPDPLRLATLQKKYSIPKAFNDCERFFQSGIEAVSITSPAPCHSQNIHDCARYGLPAICEKPLAMNTVEAEQMIEVTRKAGVSLHTAFCYRFSRSALRIRELVKEGAIGNVRSLRLIYNWNVHGKFEQIDGVTRLQKRREDRMLEGGPLVDCGTHQIDLSLFWLGSPIVAYSGHGAWVDNYDAPDHIWVHMDYANGAHSVVETSYSYCHTSLNVRREFVYELIGTNGVIRYDREAKLFAMENEKGHHQLEFYPEKDFKGLYEEWGNFLETGQSSLLTSAEEGMLVTKIARNATNEAIQKRRLNSDARSMSKMNSLS